MSAKTDGIIRSLRASIQRANDTKTKPYDTRATIRRIEGQTAWVHINGGVDETPVRLTIGARVGDEVQVRVSGGTAFLVGNGTAPPTDDRKANEVSERLTVTNKILRTVKTVAERASRIATSTAQYFWVSTGGTDNGAHVTAIPQEQFEADPTNGGGNTLMTSNGVAVRDGLAELATFSANGVQIGQDGQARSLMDYHSFSLVDSDDDTFFEVKDLRDENGEYEVTEEFISSSQADVTHEFKYYANSTNYDVVIKDTNDNDVTSQYSFSCSRSGIEFAPLGAPPAGYIITATYTTESELAKNLTFGDDGFGNPAFVVDGFGSVNTTSGYKLEGEPLFASHSFDLGVVNCSAGVPGTSSSVITKDIQRDGYAPISMYVAFMQASSIGFDVYTDGTRSYAYINLIRRLNNTATSNTSTHAYLVVTYMKN